MTHLFRRARTFWRQVLGASGLLLGGALVLSGCKTVLPASVVVGPEYKPSNVFRAQPTLPADFRRVAVLPLTSGESQPPPESSQQALETLLQTELLKAKKFELIWVSPDSLGRATGRTHWNAEDRFPTNFFGNLREQLSCDGVLFCRLSRFHAYPPLVIGWNLKLVDTKQSQTLWAVDEIFDAAEPSVSNGARRYEQQHLKAGPVTDAPAILSSPRRFGQYAAWSVLGTLPDR